MRKLSHGEKMVFGDCPVCSAPHGMPCIPVDETGGMARMQDTAHMGRLCNTPDEVPHDEAEAAPADDAPEIDINMDGYAGFTYYIDGLEKVKLSGPEWLPETRLMLMMATALYMQAAFNAGAGYGAHGLPNMQSLLELGGMTSEEMEAIRPQICAHIDNEFLPFFRDGTMKDFGGHAAELQELTPEIIMAQEIQQASAAALVIIQGVLEHNAAGTMTAEEAALGEAVAKMKVVGGEMRDAVMALDQSRWPGLEKVKWAVEKGDSIVAALRGDLMKQAEAIKPITH